MWYLVQQYSFWLLAALGLGLVIGWLTAARDRTVWWTGWTTVAAIAFVAGLILAYLRVIKGLPGLWLDSALLFFAFYIAGCLLAGWLKGLLGQADVGPVAAPMAAPIMTPVPEPTVIPETMLVLRERSAPAPRIEGEELIAGSRPAGLAAPRGGKADDLKLIRGVGKQNEGRLHGLGIWHFDQIAAWTAANVEWAGSYLAFPGRIEREDWVQQASQLAAGMETEFSQRAKSGLVPTSKDDGSVGSTNIASVLDRTKT